MDCIGSNTTWEDLVEKFVQKFYQLFNNNEEMEAEDGDDPDDIAKIFKIEGNLFDYETPLCKAFNDFNYLLKIDMDQFTFNIQGRMTYEEYKLNHNMTRDLEEPWLDNGCHINYIFQLILFIVDYGCTKHMTGNLKLLCNFIEIYLGIVCFGNDQFALILSFGDLVQGNITIKRVYYVEGLNHNLLSVGHFCDADLEVALSKSTCFVRDLQGNDLLTGNHGSDLYIISFQDTTSLTPICFMAKASPTQAWLWDRRLSHCNFNYINLLSKKDVVIGLPKLKYVKDQLCSSCEVIKAKRSSFKTKTVPSLKGWLNLLHMDLCDLMWVANINGKKYIL
nr:retrovirus-related Pol polyprotein from transposon TNT 1-94 [Tanacetum cinerariifolium]